MISHPLQTQKWYFMFIYCEVALLMFLQMYFKQTENIYDNIIQSCMY